MRKFTKSIDKIEKVWYSEIEHKISTMATERKNKMSAKLDLSRARTIQLTMDNERFIQKVWVLRDKRYTDGVGPKINKCLDFLREREELAQLLCSGPDYDIINSELSEEERGDYFDAE